MTILDPAADDDSYQRHHPTITVRWTCPGCKRRIKSKYQWPGKPGDGEDASLFCATCERTFPMQYDAAVGLWVEAR